MQPLRLPPALLTALAAAVGCGYAKVEGDAAEMEPSDRCLSGGFGVPVVQVRLS